MKTMLELTTHLPELAFGPGQTILVEGESGTGVWVLVSGALEVRKGGVVVNTITEPGAMVGEMSTLLDTGFTATVTTAEHSVLRHAADGEALLSSNPEVMRIVAVGLAERLRFVTTYLADLKQQYGDAPGLSMVADVLGELTFHRGAAMRPGSARDPEPEY